MGEFQFNEELHAAMKVVSAQAATIKRVQALADEWDRSPGREFFATTAADELRERIAAAPKLAGEE